MPNLLFMRLRSTFVDLLGNHVGRGIGKIEQRTKSHTNRAHQFNEG